MPSPARHPPRHGFTLIELLVVISVIAILASMLLPAVGMIRDLANTQKCGNTLRQWALANHGYASDNDGLSIPFRFKNPADGLDYWGLDYRGSQQYIEHEGDSSWPVHELDAPQYRGLHCPNVQDGRRYWMMYGLGMNTQVLWDALSATGFGSQVMDKVTLKTSRTFMADSVSAQLSNDVWWSAITTWDWHTNPANVADSDKDVAGVYEWEGKAFFRHRGKGQAVRWDGHVQPLTVAETTASFDDWVMRWTHP